MQTETKSKFRFVVDRRTWYRGRGDFGSRLLRDDGCRCCLGFECQSRGIADQYLLDCELPEGVLETWRFQVPKEQPVRNTLENLFTEAGLVDDGQTTDIVIRITAVNDDKDYSESDRENRLTELFAERGIEIVFEN